MALTQHTFPNETITYLAPSWNDMDGLVFAIAQKILADNIKVDRVITLAKGGWPMARPLVDYLQIAQVSSIGIKLYKGIEQRHQAPEVYEDISADITGKSVLVFDDVADTGETLEYVINYLRERGVAKIYTATLFYKPHCVIEPDYYGQETLAWIIFPYELRETMQVLVPEWQNQGLEQETIVQRLVELGFAQDIVESLYKSLFS